MRFCLILFLSLLQLEVYSQERLSTLSVSHFEESFEVLGDFYSLSGTEYGISHRESLHRDIHGYLGISITDIKTDLVKDNLVRIDPMIGYRFIADDGERVYFAAGVAYRTLGDFNELIPTGGIFLTLANHLTFQIKYSRPEKIDSFTIGAGFSL